MAHITKPRVGESTTTTGTGALALDAALTAHQRFSAVCSVSDTVWYDICAVDADGAETGDWEEGLGTYSASNELTRTTVVASTNANAAVNFGAGTKYVRLVAEPRQIAAVPRGGSSGQVLKKSSATDYDEAWATLTSSDVSLGNVTNNAQTQAAIVPNTVPSAGQLLVGNAGGTAYAPVSSSGDVTIASTGAMTIGAAKVTEAMQVLADNTTQDVSTTKHGYVPKAPNDTTKFLRGDATWAVPTKTYARFGPLENHPPSSNYATLDTRNSVLCLDFDDTTAEGAVFIGIMPDFASLASGLVVYLNWAATTATTGNVIWEVSFARMNANNQDIDGLTFDTVTASSASAANATSGKTTTPSITVVAADTDAIAAGEMFAMKVRRLPADASDTMVGDAELYAVEVRGG